MPDLIYIAGPTASGKSAHALEQALNNNGILINADSMQVYASLQLLTARPHGEVLTKAPHRLYGHIQDPNEHYSVARWRHEVIIEIEKALLQKKKPIIVGGTGLYAKALFEGLSPVPEITPQIREDLRGRSLDSDGLDSLYQELSQKDPRAHRILKSNDTQRIVRALEVALSTGKTLAHWQSQPATPLPYSVHKILLNPDRAMVVARAEKRLREMFKEGAIEEVQHLLTQCIQKDVPLYKAVGVREIKAYIEGNLTKEEAFERSLITTRQYIKRQQTWFRHQMIFDDVKSTIN